MTKTSDLPEFPTDEATLALLDLALNPRPNSERSSLGELLEMLSGYDPSKLIQINDAWVEYPEPTYHPHDVIRALVAEVRRLRASQ